MKLKKRLVGLMLTAALTTIPVALSTGCNWKFWEENSSNSSSSITSGVEDSASSSVEESMPFEEMGEYYAVVGESEYSFIIEEAACRLVMGAEELAGTYVYDGKILKISLTGGVTATAAFDGTVLTLKKGNETISFYKKVNYTVTFEMNGATAMDAVTVLNGKVLAKPDAPIKDGYWFVGWYTENTYATLYNFNTPITADTTLYARFVEKVETYEYDVDFVVDGETYAQMKTKGGVVYNSELPIPQKEGKVFLGWWVSSYGDAEKLSYQYNEQELGQPTTLYAVWESEQPIISVNSDNISWTAVGGSTYDVAIKNANGAKIAGTTTPENTFAFNFSEWAAGDYTIEVSILGENEVSTAYYKNKALDKISYISASDNRVLTFNEIKGAEKYLITIDCGDDNHVHTQVEVTTPVYDFASCQMQEGGITFTIEAIASGYISSVSDAYAYEVSLAEISGLTIDEATEIASWNPVENADAYVVEIIDDGVSLGKMTMTETTVSLRGLTGALEIKVYPISRDYNASAVQTAVFNNVRLAVPMNLKLSGYALVWDAVEGATGYVVTVGGKTYTTSTAELALIDEHFTDYLAVLSVQAICDDAAKTSLPSDAFTVRADNTMDASKLAYEKGSISWGAVLGAMKYGVRVNGGEEVTVEDALSAPIAFTQAGEAKIEVCSYNAQGNQSDWVALTVQVYSVSFNAEGGVSVDTLYKAEGDTVTTSATEYAGYTFVGWYDVSKPLENNGKKYAESFIQGASNLTLYAGYTPNSYAVTFDYGGLAEGEAEQEVTYSKPYSLPAPTCKDVTKVFAGWFSQPNAQGIQYADHNGQSSQVWAVPEDTTLYAGWYSVLKFTEVGTETERGYAVSKDEAGIRYVENLIIPASYMGLPVTMIESGAFANCSTLKTISIPDTVKTIFISSDNQTSTGSAFENCAGLQKLIVYEVVDKTYDAYFESDEAGALIYNNPNTGKKEFKFLPTGYNDGDDNASELVYAIPEGVQVIPTSAFLNSRITKVIIPASVTSIDSSAFKGSSYLKTLEFTAAEDGKEMGLTLASGVFDGCSNLLEINLPARVVELNLDIFNNKVEKINITGNPVVGATDEYYSIDGVLCQSGAIVYVPKGRAGAYRIPVVIDTIAESAFANCTKLTSVSIPGAVTSIEKKAFYGCSLLQAVTFEGTEESEALSIGEQAFYSCPLLTNIELSANITSVAAHAFGQSRTDITVKVTVKGDCAGFETNAFVSPGNYSCVTELYLGANVQNIEIAGVFGNRLTTVVIDENNPYLAAQDSVIYDAAMETLLYYPTTKLGGFRVPDGVKTIAANVFKGKKLTSIYIPASVTTISEFAFAYITNLEEIVIEDGSEALVIGQGAFTRSGVDGMVLTIPSRVTTIAEGAFANAKYGQLIFADGDMELTIGDYAFKKFDAQSTTDVDVYDTQAISLSLGRLTELTLPARLRTIGYEAFAGVFKYTANFKPEMANIDLVIPEGVTAIDNYAFSSNYMLKSVSLPASLTKFGAYSTADALTSVLVFDKCKGLQTVSVATGSTILGVSDGVVYGLDAEGKLAELYFSPRANAGVDGVVSIPATVTKVWDEAFLGSTVIHTVQFPTDAAMNVTLGGDIFADCESLKNINLPIGITEITTKMFDSCDSLEKITVPYTVTTIRKNAFYSCKSLTTVEFAPTPEGVEPVALTLESGTSSSNCFYLCSQLTNVQLPERTTAIGDYAFYKAKLTSIAIPSTVTSIGKYAFAECTALETITFAEDSALTSIATFAFNNAKKLKGIDIPDTVTTIGASAFVGCAALESVTLSDSLTAIDASVFTATPIKSIIIPASVTKIGKQAFEGCRQLTTLTFADDSTLTEIADNAFARCIVLNAVTIPATVKTIGASAFEYCLNVASLEFATNADGVSSVSKIGNYAFAGFGITEFEFPKTSGTLTLGTAIFDGCKMTNVHLSKGVTTVLGVFDGLQIKGQITVADDNVNFSAVEGQKILLDADGKGVVYVYDTIRGACDLTAFDGLTYIGKSVFANQDQMTSLILPVTVQEIQESAFSGCTSLLTVEFETKEGYDQALKTIGLKAFQNCEALQSIAIPANVTSIGNYAFSDCYNLSQIKLNAKLSTIGTYMFQNAGKNAESLSVTIPEGVKTIGDYMFQTATKLTSITLPSTITKVGKNAFSASGLAGENPVTFTEKDAGGYAVTTIDNYAFSSCKAITKFDVPSTVTTLGTYVFSNCSALADVSVPSTLKTIPNYLFQNTAISEFTIPADVTTIGSYAFSGCANLTQITIPSKVTKIDTYAFKGTGLTSISIPAKVTTIGNYAFQNCTSLTTAVLEENASSTTVSTTLGNYVFDGCTALNNITLSKHVKTIGTYAFKGTAITSMVVPEGVTSLGQQAFENCKELTEVTLGNSKLTSIGSALFKNCTALNKVTFRSGFNFTKNTSFASKMFTGCTSENFELNLPSSCTIIYNNAFYVASNVGLNITSIDLTNVTYIGTNAFQGCAKLANVTWGTKLATVENYAFDGCAALTTANISSATTKIGTYVFRGCASLTSVSLPSTLASLPNYAFQNCVSLETIELPETLQTIGTYVFSGCEKLKNIDLSTIQTIGANAFTGCTSLEAVDLSNVTTSIASNTFQNCTSLASVTLNDSLTGIGGNAFNGCTALEYITLPSGLTAIDNAAFRGSGLKEIVLPATITKLMNSPTASISASSTAYQFADCLSLEKVVLPEGFSAMGKGVFSNCPNLKEVSFPSTLYLIGDEAFKNSGLEYVQLPSGLTALGDFVFVGCNSLQSFSIASSNEYFKTQDGALYAKQQLLDYGSTTKIYAEESFLIAYPYAKISEDGIVALAEGCEGVLAGTSSGSLFSGCTTIKQIILPSTMTVISEFAFSGCDSLETVVIPQTVLEIKKGAFYKCENISTLTFEDDGNAEPLVFEDKAAYAFFTSKALTKVYLPARLGVVPYNMFGNGTNTSTTCCLNLKEVVLAEGITEIHANAFLNSGIESIELPNSLTSIGDKAFLGSKLTSFDFKNVTSVGSEAFKQTAFTTVTVPAKEITWGAGVFEECANLTKVIVEEGVTALPSEMFYACTALSEVQLSSTVTKLGNNLFSGTSALESIDLKNVTEFGVGLFSVVTLSSVKHYAGLKSVVIPEGTKYLTGVGAVTADTSNGKIFKDCINLTSVTLPSTLEMIGAYTFQGCTSLTSIDIPESVYFIGYQAFVDSAITSVELKNPEIQLYRAFSGAKALETVVLPEGMTNLGYQTFENCTALKSIELPSTLVAFDCTTVAANGTVLTNEGGTFKGSGLETIVIPEGIKYLPKEMFSGCASLTSVVLPNSLEEIDYNAFYNCKAIESLVLPANVNLIGKTVFYYWTTDQTIYVQASKAEAGANWYFKTSTDNWSYQCSAKIVYDYQPVVNGDQK